MKRIRLKLSIPYMIKHKLVAQKNRFKISCYLSGNPEELIKNFQFHISSTHMKLLYRFRLSYLQNPTVLLLVFSAFCVAMVMVRIIFTHRLMYGFLIWNLILAWIPMLLTLAMYHYQRKNGLKKWHYLTGFGLWLLFFPNSPYIITDLLHLKRHTLVPIWYDSLLVFSFAMAGLKVGLLSMYRIHQLAEKRAGTVKSWILMGSCVFLTSFGIYLGRFQRWNSWDLFVRPDKLLLDSVQQLTNPTALKVTLAFTVILTFFYLLFLSLIHLRTHEPNQ